MPISREPRRQRIDLLSRRAVDDARLAAVALEHVEELPLQRRSRQDAVEEVRPIEGADQLDRIVQPELRADVATHARRRRRGIGVDSDAGQELTQPAELTILGSEVVSPLADAVGFVHGDEAGVARGEPSPGNCRCLRRPAVPAIRTADGIVLHAVRRGPRPFRRRTTSCCTGPPPRRCRPACPPDPSSARSAARRRGRDPAGRATAPGSRATSRCRWASPPRNPGRRGRRPWLRAAAAEARCTPSSVR